MAIAERTDAHPAEKILFVIDEDTDVLLHLSQWHAFCQTTAPLGTRDTFFLLVVNLQLQIPNPEVLALV